MTERGAADVFLGGGGDAGALLRDFDWTATPLGQPSAWPQSLKTVVSIVLGSNQPMFVVWGEEGTLLYNDAYSEILASKHPRALGLPFLEVWAEIESDLMPIVAQAYAGDPVHMADIELHMQRKGYVEEAHFAFSYTPVRDDTGTIGGFFCACTETTGQILADRKVAAETARQRRLFQQAPGFITILGQPNHIFEFVNEAYVRLFGDRNYLGRTVRDVFPELEGQGFFEWLDEAYETGERRIASHVPVRLRLTPDGPEVERCLDFFYEPVVDEHGQVTGIFCEGYDVTESHVVQTALRESEVQLRALNATLEERVAEALAERRILADVVETTDAFIQVSDLDYRWLAINRASADEFERIYGVRPKAGDSMLDLLAGWPEHKAAVEAVWSRALAGEAFTTIDEFGDSDRRRRFYEMKFNVLRDAEGHRSLDAGHDRNTVGGNRPPQAPKTPCAAYLGLCRRRRHRSGVQAPYKALSTGGPGRGARRPCRKLKVSDGDAAATTPGARRGNRRHAWCQIDSAPDSKIRKAPSAQAQQRCS